MGDKLTISFLTYSEIEKLSGSERIKRILNIVMKNKIVILQGRLRSEEEISLIQSTMVIAGHLKRFKGVELAVISPKDREASRMSRFKMSLVKALGGSNELTIIGPATIVKEIKKDPSKIELMLKK